MRSFLSIPGYNWRMLTLLVCAPIAVLTALTFFFTEESPRWVLIAHGEDAARALLGRIARRNGVAAGVVDKLQLRVPAQTQQKEAAYQLFCTAGMRWRSE